MNNLPGYDARTSTIDRVLRDRGQQWGDKTFLNWLPTGTAMSYRQLDELTLRVGSGLAAAGVEVGSHVGVLMENCPEQLLAILGPARCGFVSVPLNAAAKGQLLAYFLNHADCTALIVEEALLSRFLEASEMLPRVHHIFVVRPDRGEPKQTPSLIDSVGEHVMHEFEGLLDAPALLPDDAPAFNDLAMLLFTSGTTGPSKAIMYTHAHFIYWGSDVAFHHEYTPHDIAYVFLPLFHGNALLGSTMGSLMAGASIALTYRFSVSKFWEHIRNSGATVFNGVGAVTNFLWKQAPSPSDLDHQVRRCHLAPVPGFAKGFEERFGMTIMSAFGLTDYCLGAAYNTKSRRDKLGSCGLPRAGIDLRVVDENDFDMAPGEPGEIVMRNNNPWGASLGYYKQPEATSASRRNLWFHTGDRGSIDADGYVWYTDRIKDAIRRRGENISAFEVEEVIRTYPAVSDVAVYPVHAETSEDEVAVTITLKPGESANFSYESLIKYCSHNLAYFMVPRYVQVAKEMPMTLSQKVEKYKLRREAESDLSALWDRERAGITIAR
jgi:crotonobetaine/carnitine-CoA ligase